jgi:hypothetical protein
VFCDKCDLAMHQRCINLDQLPPSDAPWFCDVCKAGGNPSETACAICLKKGGCFARTAQHEWAHVVCALHVPETCLSDETPGEDREIVMGVDQIIPRRRSLRCGVCRDPPGGACVQCNHRSCAWAVHPSCVASAPGVLSTVAPKGPGLAHMVYVVYCPVHSKDVGADGEVRSQSSSSKDSRPRVRKSTDRPRGRLRKSQDASPRPAASPPPPQPRTPRVHRPTPEFDYFDRPESALWVGEPLGNASQALSSLLPPMSPVPLMHVLEHPWAVHEPELAPPTAEEPDITDFMLKKLLSRGARATVGSGAAAQMDSAGDDYDVAVATVAPGMLRAAGIVRDAVKKDSGALSVSLGDWAVEASPRPLELSEAGRNEGGLRIRVAGKALKGTTSSLEDDMDPTKVELSRFWERVVEPFMRPITIRSMSPLLWISSRSAVRPNYDTFITGAGLPLSLPPQIRARADHAGISQALAVERYLFQGGWMRGTMPVPFWMQGGGHRFTRDLSEAAALGCTANCPPTFEALQVALVKNSHPNPKVAFKLKTLFFVDIVSPTTMRRPVLRPKMSRQALEEATTKLASSNGGWAFSLGFMQDKTWAAQDESDHWWCTRDVSCHPNDATRLPPRLASIQQHSPSPPPSPPLPSLALGKSQRLELVAQHFDARQQFRPLPDQPTLESLTAAIARCKVQKRSPLAYPVSDAPPETHAPVRVLLHRRGRAVLFDLAESSLVGWEPVSGEDQVRALVLDAHGSRTPNGDSIGSSSSPAVRSVELSRDCDPIHLELAAAQSRLRQSEQRTERLVARLRDRIKESAEWIHSFDLALWPVADGWSQADEKQQRSVPSNARQVARIARQATIQPQDVLKPVSPLDAAKQLLEVTKAGVGMVEEAPRQADGFRASSVRDLAWEALVEAEYTRADATRRIRGAIRRGVRDRASGFNRPIHEPLPPSWVVPTAGRDSSPRNAHTRGARHAPHAIPSTARELFQSVLRGGPVPSLPRRRRRTRAKVIDDDARARSNEEDPTEEELPDEEIQAELEDAICGVCQDAMNDDSDPIVYCDRCNLAVHSRCYGVQREDLLSEDKEWTCRPCSFMRKLELSVGGTSMSPYLPLPTRTALARAELSISCRICGLRGGALVREADSQRRWIHVFCALALPGSWVGDPWSMRGVSARPFAALLAAKSSIASDAQLRALIRFGKGQASPPAFAKLVSAVATAEMWLPSEAAVRSMIAQGAVSAADGDTLLAACELMGRLNSPLPMVLTLKASAGGRASIRVVGNPGEEKIERGPTEQDQEAEDDAYVLSRIATPAPTRFPFQSLSVAEAHGKQTLVSRISPGGFPAISAFLDENALPPSATDGVCRLVASGMVGPAEPFGSDLGQPSGSLSVIAPLFVSTSAVVGLRRPRSGTFSIGGKKAVLQSRGDWPAGAARVTLVLRAQTSDIHGILDGLLKERSSVIAAAPWSSPGERPHGATAGSGEINGELVPVPKGASLVTPSAAKRATARISADSDEAASPWSMEAESLDEARQRKHLSSAPLPPPQGDVGPLFPPTGYHLRALSLRAPETLPCAVCGRFDGERLLSRLQHSPLAAHPLCAWYAGWYARALPAHGATHALLTAWTAAHSRGGLDMHAGGEDHHPQTLVPQLQHEARLHQVYAGHRATDPAPWGTVFPSGSERTRHLSDGMHGVAPPPWHFATASTSVAVPFPLAVQDRVGHGQEPEQFVLGGGASLVDLVLVAAPGEVPPVAAARKPRAGDVVLGGRSALFQRGLRLSLRHLPRVVRRFLAEFHKALALRLENIRLDSIPRTPTKRSRAELPWAGFFGETGEFAFPGPEHASLAQSLPPELWRLASLRSQLQRGVELAESVLRREKLKRARVLATIVESVSWSLAESVQATTDREVGTRVRIPSAIILSALHRDENVGTVNSILGGFVDPTHEPHTNNDYHQSLRRAILGGAGSIPLAGALEADITSILAKLPVEDPAWTSISWEALLGAIARAPPRERTGADVTTQVTESASSSSREVDGGLSQGVAEDPLGFVSTSLTSWMELPASSGLPQWVSPLAMIPGGNSSSSMVGRLDTWRMAGAAEVARELAARRAGTSNGGIRPCANNSVALLDVGADGLHCDHILSDGGDTLAAPAWPEVGADDDTPLEASLREAVGSVIMDEAVHFPSDAVWVEKYLRSEHGAESLASLHRGDLPTTPPPHNRPLNESTRQVRLDCLLFLLCQAMEDARPVSRLVSVSTSVDQAILHLGGCLPAQPYSEYISADSHMPQRRKHAPVRKVGTSWEQAEGRSACAGETFMVLPPPGSPLFSVAENPVTLLEIRRRVLRQQYHSLDDFLADARALVKNARTAFDKSHPVYADASTVNKALSRCLDQYKFLSMDDKSFAASMSSSSSAGQRRRAIEGEGVLDESRAFRNTRAFPEPPLRVGVYDGWCSVCCHVYPLRSLDGDVPRPIPRFPKLYQQAVDKAQQLHDANPEPDTSHPHPAVKIPEIHPTVASRTGAIDWYSRADEVTNLAGNGLFGPWHVPWVCPHCVGAFGERFLGRPVWIFWDGDDVWYQGTLASFEPRSRRHRVHYGNDWEFCDLSRVWVVWAAHNGAHDANFPLPSWSPKTNRACSLVYSPQLSSPSCMSE